LETDHQELRGFSRSYAELEWLLLALVLLYFAVPDTYVASEFALVVAMSAFAAFVLLFRYANFYQDYTRFKLVLEAWMLVLFVSTVLWLTGRHESPLINLFLLVIIFSSLTLGKMHTLALVAAIAAIYLLMGYSVQGPGIISLQSFSALMAGVVPFLLVAYLTTMLSSDIQLAKGEVKQMATTDELTDVLNMRAFRFVFDKELRRSARYAKGFSLLMIDADGFKKTNDLFGHRVGDRLLQLLATKFQMELRSSDTLARYGGDEFVVLLPEAGKDTALTVAERLRGTISSLSMEEQSQQYRPSVSIGVASYPDDGLTVTDLLDSADKALYESKHKGGDSVTACGVSGGVEARPATG